MITTLLDAGYMPVISPPAIAETGEVINVDGDRAAAVLGAALGAEALLIFSNVPGLLRDVSDESSLIREVSKGRLDEAMGVAKGRFKKKIMGVAEALDGGLQQVIIADARVEQPIQRALAGEGTVIR